MQLPVTPYKIKKAFRYWKHFGTGGFIDHLRDRLEVEEVPYASWFDQHKATEEDLRNQKNHPLEDGPWISVIVPAYHTPERFFVQMAESLLSQSYANWELVVADAGANEEKKTKKGRTVREMAGEYHASDARICYVELPENGGIAVNTNAGIEAAHGEYVAFLDHDDFLEPDALYEIALRIINDGADMIYTDEDKVSADRMKYYQPHFKPEFNLDLLRSNNYITHFLAVKKSLALEAGMFDPEMDGAQDYDFIFRCAERASKIVRVPRILYHWRTHVRSTADNPMSKQYAYEAGKRAIEGNLERSGIKGEVEMLPDFGFYRVRYELEDEPLVSVIIANRDDREGLKTCLDALFKADYNNIEIIIVENGSRLRETFEYYRELSELDQVHLVRWKKIFNFSAINNYGVKFAKGDYLLFLNNDVRGSISTDWITEMLSVCARPDVGAVGPKLYYPDDRIQSAGMVVGMGGIAGSLFTDLKKGRSGYFHKADIMQDLSAVTAACMMVKKEAFVRAGGFTEELAVAFNDVDFCLKLAKCGFRVVYDPFAQVYHDEARTRGVENAPEDFMRLQKETEYMQAAWPDILRDGDPCYDPNLSLKKCNYSLRI